MTTPAPTHQFHINPNLDIEAFSSLYRRNGRVHVPDFLAPETAKLIHEKLAGTKEWTFTINRGNSHFELTPENARAMPREGHIQLHKYINDSARNGFQLAYEVLNVSKKERQPITDDPMLCALHAFMNGPDYMGFMRKLTGEDGASWCDVTATRYRPNHFCGVHDDWAEDGQRLAAFVINLTPRWRPDWGGMLLFLDKSGHVIEGLRPAFNAVNVFKTPQPHMVSMVAPFAGAPRLSITGWLRP